MSLTPTYSGYIGLTKDAVLVIQGVLNQELNSVHRRPHERERAELIRLGHVFVFIEEQLGIKRWTDGVAWSPSRILGRFLVYRELDRGAMGDVKRRRKRSVAKAAAAAAAAGGHSPQLNLLAHGSPSNPYISLPSTSTSTSGSSFYPDYGLIKNAFCRHHSEKHQTNRPLGVVLPGGGRSPGQIVPAFSYKPPVHAYIARLLGRRAKAAVGRENPHRGRSPVFLGLQLSTPKHAGAHERQTAAGSAAGPKTAVSALSPPAAAASCLPVPHAASPATSTASSLPAEFSPELPASAAAQLFLLPAIPSQSASGAPQSFSY